MDTYLQYTFSLTDAFPTLLPARHRGISLLCEGRINSNSIKSMVDRDRMTLCREEAGHGCSATVALPRDLPPRPRNPTCEKKTDGQTLQVSSGLRVKLIKNGGDMSHKNEVLLPQAEWSLPMVYEHTSCTWERSRADEWLRSRLWIQRPYPTCLSR